jgi:hypothetical protein
MGAEDLDEVVKTAQAHQLRVYQDRIAARLASLLEMRFTPRFSCPAEEYLAKTFRNANEALSGGDIEGARLLNLANAKLLQCLYTIQEYDKKLLEEFRHELHNADIDNYFGVRREIETARSLIKNGYGFEHPDPPDFVVQYQNQSIEIECTGIRIKTSSDHRQKICDRINEKDGKYAGDSTALFIDMTDVFHESAENENSIKMEELKSWISDDTQIFDWDLGSILIWSYIYDRADQNYHHAYIRVDTANIAAELEGFLESTYPIGEFSPENGQLHSQN